MNKATKEFLLRLQGQAGGGGRGYTRYICIYIYIYIQRERSLVGGHRALALILFCVEYLSECREDIKSCDEPKHGEIIKVKIERRKRKIISAY